MKYRIKRFSKVYPYTKRRKHKDQNGVGYLSDTEQQKVHDYKEIYDDLPGHIRKDKDFPEYLSEHWKDDEGQEGLCRAVEYANRIK